MSATQVGVYSSEEKARVTINSPLDESERYLPKKHLLISTVEKGLLMDFLSIGVH